MKNRYGSIYSGRSLDPIVKYSPEKWYDVEGMSRYFSINSNMLDIMRMCGELINCIDMYGHLLLNHSSYYMRNLLIYYYAMNGYDSYLMQYIPTRELFDLIGNLQMSKHPIFLCSGTTMEAGWGKYIRNCCSRRNKPFVTVIFGDSNDTTCPTYDCSKAQLCEGGRGS